MSFEKTKDRYIYLTFTFFGEKINCIPILSNKNGRIISTEVHKLSGENVSGNGFTIKNMITPPRMIEMCSTTILEVK